jgi:hypothetical protein
VSDRSINSEYALLINNIAWRFIKTGRHCDIDWKFRDIDGDSPESIASSSVNTCVWVGASRIVVEVLDTASPNPTHGGIAAETTDHHPDKLDLATRV